MDNILEAFLGDGCGCGCFRWIGVAVVLLALGFGVVILQESDLIAQVEQTVTDFQADREAERVEDQPTLNSPIEYNNRGEQFLRDGRYRQAIEDFNQALALANTYATAYFNRGEAYLNLGEYDNAFNDYNAAVTRDPFLAGAYRGRGDVYVQRQQYSSALEDFNSALRVNPTYLETYVSRGGLYAAQGQYERAIEDYNRILDTDPNNAEALAARGDAYYELGENREARADYRRYEEVTGELTPTMRTRMGNTVSLSDSENTFSTATTCLISVVCVAVWALGALLFVGVLNSERFGSFSADLRGRLQARRL